MKTKKTKQQFPSEEFKLLAELAKVLGPYALPGGAFKLTLGDDAAIRCCRKDERIVLTTDSAVENVHFSLKTMSFKEVGYRVMAANVSDCAAMAALPEGALVNLVFPRHAENLQKDLVELYRGFAEACRRWRFKVVGGDCSLGPCWSVHITLTGVAPAGGRLLLRKGARPGDRLWVSSFPGRSAAGFAALERWGRRSAPARYRRLAQCHIRPDPCPELGIVLGKCNSVHAMMDLSDGISKDCRTLCHENRLGLDLSLDGITPPRAMANLAAELCVPWTEWFLHGGEEYSLLFAASAAFTAGCLPEKYRASLVPLGVFNRNCGKILVRRGNNESELGRGGWDHLGE